MPNGCCGVEQTVMRVIAGVAKGRRLAGPPGLSTRPFTGRAKEAVFSMLGRRVEAAAILDLYAGSGSLGIEALSRGASFVTFVESDRNALETLRRNLDVVDLGGTVVGEDVVRFLETCEDVFDVVFVDPPFALSREAVDRVVAAVGTIVADEGVVIVHRRTGTPLDLAGVTMFSISDVRRYGDSEVWWLDKEAR